MTFSSSSLKLPLWPPTAKNNTCPSNVSKHSLTIGTHALLLFSISNIKISPSSSSYCSSEPSSRMWAANRNLHCGSSSSSLPLLLVFAVISVLLIACTRLGPATTLIPFSSVWSIKSVSLPSIPNSISTYSRVLNDTDSLLLPPKSDDDDDDDDVASASGVVVVRRHSKLERLEATLARVRASIKEAAQNGSRSTMISTQKDPDHVPQGPIYRNANAFHRSYLEMEKHFKMYVYEEGEIPMFHNGPCRSIYSTEGRFIHEMERGNIYRTDDPDEASVYFLPFSVVVMVQYLHQPGSHDMHPIGRTVSDYINLISHRHPFWNRSLGADHVMLSCHDWGPSTSAYVPEMYKNSIRVLCNANTTEGFNPVKDVSLPEIHLKTGEITGLVGGPSPSRRSILAFFAGRLHGDIRSLLLQQWKDKDEDVQVYDSLPENVSYESKLRESRFCLCPSGYEVASPRVVEAIYAECVPVLISEGYVPPFSDVLNWKSFAVVMEVEDIPNIKKILKGISQTQYLRMQRRVKQVQRHFVINGTPKRFDLFHMILHSVWLRRLNIRIQDA